MIDCRSEKIKNFHRKRIELLKKSLPFEKWPKRLIRKVVFEEVGNHCGECGYEYEDKITGKGPFDLHHKDGDKQNWKRENLKVLCLNCHWKTGSWKFRNKRHSADSRRRISENNVMKKLKRNLGTFQYGYSRVAQR